MNFNLQSSTTVEAYHIGTTLMQHRQTSCVSEKKCLSSAIDCAEFYYNSKYWEVIRCTASYCAVLHCDITLLDVSCTSIVTSG